MIPLPFLREAVPVARGSRRYGERAVLILCFAECEPEEEPGAEDFVVEAGEVSWEEQRADRDQTSEGNGEKDAVVMNTGMDKEVWRWVSDMLAGCTSRFLS